MKIHWREVEAWLGNPVTLEWKRRVEQEIQEKREALSDGACLRKESPDRTAMEYAEVCGWMQGALAVLNLDLRDGQVETGEDEDDGEEPQ